MRAESCVGEREGPLGGTSSPARPHGFFIECGLSPTASFGSLCDTASFLSIRRPMCMLRRFRVLLPVCGLSVALLVLPLAGCSSDASSDDRSIQDRHAAEEAAGHGEEEPELARYMIRVQRWSHKVALSVRARNQPLADFYLHELEETVASIQSDVPSYEGYSIAKQTKQIFVPSLDALDAAVDAADWPVANARLREMAHSCNQCHRTTGHGFIRVRFDSLSNPFAQSFEPER